MIVPSKTASQSIQGTLTQIVIQTYHDRDLVLISQLNGKIGQILDLVPSASLLPNITAEGLLPPPDTYAELKTLLGTARGEEEAILHNLYASQVSSLLAHQDNLRSQGHRKRIVLGLGLKQIDEPREAERFRCIARMIQDLLGRSS